MLLKNPTDIVIKVESLGLTIEPGATAEVEDGYCQYRRSANGVTYESIIEMLAPQLVPADADLVDAYRAHTLEVVAPATNKVQGVRYEDLAGLPPAAQQMVVEGAAVATAKPAPKGPTLKQQAAAAAEAAKK